MYGKQIVGYVLSPVELSGGKIELTRWGEELYRKKELAVGSLLLVKDERSKHVILTTNARETNVLFEERSVYQALRKEGRVERRLEGIDVGQVIMEFSLVGEVYEEGNVTRLDRPSRPPSPGSEVYQLDKEDRDVLFKGYVVDVLGKLREEYEELKDAFKFGRVIGSKDLEGLILRPKINMHLGIVGTTGSGKSFTAGALIEGIARYAREIREYKDVTTSVIVFDVHGDYVSTYGDKDREIDKYETRGTYRDDIVIVSLRRSIWRDSLVLGIDFVYEEGEISKRIVPLYTPSELAAIVKLLYGASGSGAYRSLIERLFEYEEDSENLLTILHEYAKGNITFGEAREEIERLVDFVKDAQVEFTTNTKRAAKRALFSFLDRIKEFLRYPSGPEDNIVGPKQLIEYARRNTLVIIDLSGSGAKGIDNTIKDIAISYVMRVLYNNLADEFRNTDNRLIFLIDEAQTFIPAKDYDTGAVLTKKVVRMIASQGRKFGFSLVLISQRPAFMDPHAFSLVNSLIVHRTAIGDAERLARLFGLPRSIAEVFSNQRTGEAFVFGQMFGLPMRIKVRKGIDKKLI